MLYDQRPSADNQHDDDDDMYAYKEIIFLIFNIFFNLLK